MTVLVLALTGGSAQAEKKRPLAPHSVYVKRPVMGGADYVSVEPLGSDVRIRVVRVAMEDQCPRVVVQAAETIVPRTTVGDVVATRVCDVSQKRIDRALKGSRAREQQTDSFPSLVVVVADCGEFQADLGFLNLHVIDVERLNRKAPEVEALWTLGDRLQARVMGPEHPVLGYFGDAPPDVRAAREALGTAVVPDLLAGPFGVDLKGLRGYTGPRPPRDPASVEVIERASLKLAHYVDPVMPKIAISALVTGDVRLKVSANRDTGAVTNVEVMAGAPLLIDAAVTAAKQWRFAPGAVPTEPVDATVRFQLRCPE
jgi:hypothetical protein